MDGDQDDDRPAGIWLPVWPPGSEFPELLGPEDMGPRAGEPEDLGPQPGVGYPWDDAPGQTQELAYPSAQWQPEPQYQQPVQVVYVPYFVPQPAYEQGRPGKAPRKRADWMAVLAVIFALLPVIGSSVAVFLAAASIRRAHWEGWRASWVALAALPLAGAGFTPLLLSVL